MMWMLLLLRFSAGKVSKSRRIMIVLKDDAYKTNKAKCIKEKYNLPPFDINANLNAAKRINQPQKIHVVVAVAVADIAIVSVVVVVVF